MAKANKVVTKVSDKLEKVSENFSINMFDNGFMVDVGGKDFDGEWKSAKILCNSLDEVLRLVTEIASMERDS